MDSKKPTPGICYFEAGITSAQARAAKDLGLTVKEFLEQGVTICVVRDGGTQSRSPTASSSSSKRSRAMVELVGERSVADNARRIGAKVMTEREFQSLLSSIPPSTNKPALTAGEVFVGRRSFKVPVPGSAGARLSIRDLDGLFEDRSKLFSSRALERCVLHQGAPPGVSFYTPRGNWPATAAIPAGQLDSAPDASDGEARAAEVDDDAQKLDASPRYEAKTARRGGICECCGVTFVATLGEHCDSEQHRAFMAEDANFSQFDSWVGAFRARTEAAVDGEVVSEARKERAQLPQHPETEAPPCLLEESVSSAVPAAEAAAELSATSVRVSAPKRFKGAASIAPKEPVSTAASVVLKEPQESSGTKETSDAKEQSPTRKEASPLKSRQLPPRASKDSFVAKKMQEHQHFEGGDEDFDARAQKRAPRESEKNETSSRLVGRRLTKGAGGRVQQKTASGYLVKYDDGDDEEMSSEELSPWLEPEKKPAVSFVSALSMARADTGKRSWARAEPQGPGPCSNSGNTPHERPADPAVTIESTTEVKADGETSRVDGTGMESPSPPPRPSLQRSAKDLVVASSLARQEDAAAFSSPRRPRRSSSISSAEGTATQGVDLATAAPSPTLSTSSRRAAPEESPGGSGHRGRPRGTSWGQDGDAETNSPRKGRARSADDTPRAVPQRAAKDLIVAKSLAREEDAALRKSLSPKRSKQDAAADAPAAGEPRPSPPFSSPTSKSDASRGPVEFVPDSAQSDGSTSPGREYRPRRSKDFVEALRVAEQEKNHTKFPG